ncbi:MAG: class I poly(R)-hydroxyalkanoic acid synthase [Alphaproteobacteria bacterium]|nr:MAG: class I poly(R)-hydroxyalkanoic acid synthase [Alphaproteobacteria bacterium]
MSQHWRDLAERAQPLIKRFMDKQKLEAPEIPGFDPYNLAKVISNLSAQAAQTNPAHFLDAQLGWWQDWLEIWRRSSRRFLGGETEGNEPLLRAPSGDRRFQDPAWTENAVFSFIKQSYLLTARSMQSMVEKVEGLDEKTERRLDFYVRQFVDALSPSNFLGTNPQVLRETLSSGGENLIKGLSNLLEDLERGEGDLRIAMTDDSAFKLGENLAITPGKVVFRNHLMELIHYEPITPKVHAAPLLIVPPWINKFYILDMREKNSFVRFALEQGHAVFMLSWVNPDSRHRDVNFEDYMSDGILAALQAIHKATKATHVNAIGYCLGGTLLASTMAFLAAGGAQKLGLPASLPQISSATFFVTLMDFAEPGELEVFIDEEQIHALESRMAERGYLEGHEMATTFNMLRANDLIWSFVVNNYLLGREPLPFDLLYWNADSTNMPAAMHSFYLRNMYQRNLLAKPNGISLHGVPIDLRRIKTPSFFLSTREDHIAPWASTYAGTQLLKGQNRFVLAGSGHIAGVINPPASGKYGYWTNTRLPAEPQVWLESAKAQEGSWWPHWAQWLGEHAGPMVTAWKPGAGGLKALADAPGTYVRMRMAS